ncbi:MAG: hypothetical protein ACI93P_000740 [bacterium]|jgi:hypothetical protein
MYKKIVDHIYRKDTFANRVLNFFYTFYYNKTVDHIVIKVRFFRTFGFFPNLTNPKTFNEKIQWIKLNYMNDSKRGYADKYLVREYVRNTIGIKYLIPLVFQTKDLSKVIEEVLPNFPCILKVNHSSGNVFIIKDKRKHDLENTKKHLRFELRQNFYHLNREVQYRDITPRVLVEKLLLTADGEIPEDVKIHCFHGVPKFIQIDTSRFNEHKRSMYDVDWNFLDFKWKKEKGNEIPKPENLNEILRIAKDLSAPFLYTRVDLYNVENEIFFGELTFTPGSGYLTFETIEIDLAWGKELDLLTQ